MELGDAQRQTVATIVGNKPLTKDKTVKIRMDAVELLELDAIGKNLGFAERATTIRTLMRMFRELEQARRIVETYKARKAAEATFNAVLDAT